MNNAMLDPIPYGKYVVCLVVYKLFDTFDTFDTFVYSKLKCKLLTNGDGVEFLCD